VQAANIAVPAVALKAGTGRSDFYQIRPLGVETGRYRLSGGISVTSAGAESRKLWLQLLEGSFKLIYKDGPKMTPQGDVFN
jgi:hypothetical protein